MSYQYPEHFKYPDQRMFFTDHIPVWEGTISSLKGKSNITLEIGALYGGSSTYIIDEFCKEEGSHHYIMDINTNEYVENNIKPYKDKVTYLLGESADSFKSFKHNNETKEFLDLIYIDGNHMSKYVLEDAVNSFYCLKNNGYIIFDDFGGGWEQEKHMQVKTAVQSFMHSYFKYVNIIHIGYQLILQKIEYTNEFEMKENYYKV
jgi:predicted O-methyltransferase YrrM